MDTKSLTEKLVYRVLQEPVLFSGAFRAGLLAIMAFGLSLSPEQLASVMFFVEAVLSFLTRGSVTPVADPDPEAGFGL